MRVGLLLLTVTDVSTTCAVVIFRVKASCIMSQFGLKIRGGAPLDSPLRIVAAKLKKLKGTEFPTTKD